MPEAKRRTTRWALFALGFSAFLAASAVAAQGQVAKTGDPMRDLRGEWNFTGFVVGEAEFSSTTRCGPITVASPRRRLVTFSASCDGAGKYDFRLAQGSDPETYMVTVKSDIGISVVDFPVAFFDERGWRGEAELLVSNETLSITVMVAPIEGRNWHGWRILALPTAALRGGADKNNRPYFMADITRRR